MDRSIAHFDESFYLLHVKRDNGSNKLD